MNKAKTFGDWIYAKDTKSKSITILRYLGSDTEVTVPAQIDGMNVYNIYSFVFSKTQANANIKRVVFSEGIQKIDSMALFSSNIQEVVLPNTMKEVNGSGFSETVKKVIVNPDNPFFFDIDGVLFNKENKNKHLVYFPSGRISRTYRIPDGTTHIDWYAFTISKHLERVVMPNSVIDLNNLAFKDCPKLVSVRLSPNIEKLKENTFYNCFELADVRVSRKIKTIAPDAFKDCPKFNGINIQTRTSVQER
jgi:hypothetical protein